MTVNIVSIPLACLLKKLLHNLLHLLYKNHQTLSGIEFGDSICRDDPDFNRDDHPDLAGYATYLTKYDAYSLYVNKPCYDRAYQ